MEIEKIKKISFSENSFHSEYEYIWTLSATLGRNQVHGNQDQVEHKLNSNASH